MNNVFSRLGFAPSDTLSTSLQEQVPVHSPGLGVQDCSSSPPDLEMGLYLPASVEEESYMSKIPRTRRLSQSGIPEKRDELTNQHEMLRKELRTISSNSGLDEFDKKTELENTLRRYQNIFLQVSRRKSLDDTPSKEKDTLRTFHDESRNLCGCKHYIRNCKLLCVGCNVFYTCRHCHDALVGLHHKMRCSESKSMLCMHCCEIQPPSWNCRKCNTTMAEYFCPKCLFFSTSSKYTFKHCEKCDSCRSIERGEEMEHCYKCQTCMKVGHKCLEFPVSSSNCTVCHQSLQEAVEEIILPPNCNHPLHSRCFNSLITSCTTVVPYCPMCRKTLLDERGKVLLSAQYDKLVKSTELPEDLDNLFVNMYCNDCQQLFMDVKWHFYFKCPLCGGYNTRVE